MKFIEVEKLVAEIERRMDENCKLGEKAECFSHRAVEDNDVLAIIESLQEEREIVELSFKGGTYRVNGEEHAFKRGKAKVIILEINQEEGNE